MGCNACIQELRELAIPGVHLPNPEIFSNCQVVSLLKDLSVCSEFDIIKWNAFILPSLFRIYNTPKTQKDVLKPFQDLFADKIIKYKELLPPDYKYFGVDNCKENLTTFLRSNAFFSSILIAKKEENTGRPIFEVISKGDKDEDITFFSKTSNALDNSYLRVNARFDENLNLICIQSYKYGIKYEQSEEDSCACLMFLILYYSEVVHATIHVFHLLMVTGIADSTQHSDVMYNWAKPYFPNVYLKHQEVELLLFGPTGALVGKLFKADRNYLLEVAKEIISLWGNCKSAYDFINKFLLKSAIRNGLSQIQNAGILEEFLKHVDLLNPYAFEISREFGKLNCGKDLDTCNNNIRKFFKNTGDGVSDISDIIQWIELMSVTGIMHGNTLSFTRLMITQPILKLVTNNPNFGSVESEFLQTTSSTIVGVIDDRSVFSDKLCYDYKKFGPELKGVINKFAGLSSSLKVNYFSKIKKNIQISVK